MKLTDFEVLTFGCYGTLIDWERGIMETLEPWLAPPISPPQAGGIKGGVTATPAEILEAFARHEAEQEAAHPSMLYPELLARVHQKLAQEWGVRSTEADGMAFGASVGKWPAFPDSAPALQYLKRYYKLVILSNVDRASFAASNEKLGVAFDLIITAQDVGSYKPNPANFDYLLRQLAGLGIEKSKILHTAQSLFHDHVPATQLGLATNWIDRRHGREGWGATPPPPAEVTINFRASSMADFVKQHQASVDPIFEEPASSDAATFGI